MKEICPLPFWSGICVLAGYFKCLGMKFEMRRGEFVLKGAARAQSCAGAGAGELEKLMEGTAWEAYGAEV